MNLKMKKKLLILSLLFLFLMNAESGKAQKYPEFTPVVKRLESFKKRKAARKNSILNAVKFRSVGPTICSGRVADIDVNPQNPIEFYVAYASGGLWKTQNNGMSFVPLFDDEAAMTIGDIAVDWKNAETIWVGTGEANAFLFGGIGVYKSTDKGKNWQYMGLGETTHISEIIINPENPDIVWVASPGHLWSANKERGVFKTTDGGKNWKKTLFINEITGVSDLKINPQNPKILYAASWERMRQPWRRIKSGENSGIYKSTDGGETWKLITNENSGFPRGKGVGRIGISIHAANPNIIYASLDNQFKRKPKESTGLKITKEELKTMPRGKFLALEPALIKNFLKKYKFPAKYSLEKVREMVKNFEIEPADLVLYLEDANRRMFDDLPIKGAEVYRSDDGGETWRKTHKAPLDDLFYSYGYVFDLIRVDPNDADKIYIGGVPLLSSDDGGKTFYRISRENVHADHHALWINPKKRGHLINGNDGGVNLSYDDGNTWFKANTPAVAQLYAVNCDNKIPYKLFAGMQDNGVWYASSDYQHDLSWRQYGQYPYKEINGGDGMLIQIDSRDNNTIFSGFQYGNYSKSDLKTGDRKRVKPTHVLGEPPLRFNWKTPIHLSVHNQDILYFGSNKFHRSLNQGKTFETMSADLTKGGKSGDVPFGTLTCIDESPLKYGLIYTGSDDGLAHVSKDGGFSWTNISASLPENYWISSLQASAHKESRVYIALNGYRFDNYTPYIFVSENYGKDWKRVGEELPLEPVFVVKEDPQNSNLLYVGTQNGLYASLNRGESFMEFASETLPNVAVFDLAIQPRDKELIVGTHGRSIYIAKLHHLQKLTPEILALDFYLFEINPLRYSKYWGKSWNKWQEKYEPEIDIPLYVKNASTAKVRILSKTGIALQNFEYKCQKGLNFIPYDLSLDKRKRTKYEKDLKSSGNNREAKIEEAENGKYYLYRGLFFVEVEINGVKKTEKLLIN